MKTVKKVAMVIIMTNDLAAATEFYKKLGLRLIFQVKDQWAEFVIDNLKVGICPTQEKIALHRTGIVFEMANLNDFYLTHEDEFNFLDKPVQASHGMMASLQDPSGNIIDLYEPSLEKMKDLAQKLGIEDGCCGGGKCGEKAMPIDSCC
jgi:catechol 2,3-dioxygenase-like lactoylglutathione lyase family enzyme